MPDWRSEFKRLEGAYAPATIRSYFIDFGIFAEWCEQNAISPLPASPAAIVAFLEAQADHKALATLDRRLYSIRRAHHSIRRAHRLLGLKDPTTAEDDHLAYRRIKCSKFGRPRQAKGLTTEYLRQFLDAQPVRYQHS
jgi:integrase/recombinase XerD